MDEKLDLHAHNVKFSMAKQKHSTKALVLTCNREKASKMKNMLYKMNVDSCKEKQRWSQTGTWFFAPFCANSPIASLHIAKMIKCQNIFIQDAANITVSGITDIKAHVKNLTPLPLPPLLYGYCP
eukprot:2124905-Ditylum_brightwellii.AAC.1